MSKDKKEFGARGEEIAHDYLISKGFEIIRRNYRYGRGEIDLIVKKDEILIFVEVKSRKNLEYGPPELSVTKRQQRQIRRTASAYLYENGNDDCDCRIDVIAILMKGKEKPAINHIINAF